MYLCFTVDLIVWTRERRTFGRLLVAAASNFAAATRVTHLIFNPRFYIWQRFMEKTKFKASGTLP